MKMFAFLFIICISFKSFSQSTTDSTVVESSTIEVPTRPTWQYCSTSKSGDKYYLRSSPESINIEDKQVKIWVRCICRTFTYGKGKVAKNAILRSLYIFDCKEKKEKTLYLVLSSASGVTLDESDYEDDWKVIIPDSVFEAVFEKVCSLYLY